MSYQKDPLQWIASAGGPLILLPGEYISDWTGVGLFDEQLDFEIMPPPKGDDYERACAVEGYLGLLEVGSGHGLVLGDDPMSTAWWQHSASEGILIRWVYGDGEADLMQLLMPIDDRIWTSSDLIFVVGKHPLFLFDSALCGEEATDERLTITLADGPYTIDTAIVRPNARTEMVLHRLRRQELIP